MNWILLVLSARRAGLFGKPYMLLPLSCRGHLRNLMNNRGEAASMRRKAKRYKANRARTKLALPDLENAKSAVLVSLRSPQLQRSYRRSIDDFVCWYCSERRLSFNKAVVTRYRIHLEDRFLAPATINVRLAAVRRLAYEAADTGLLSPELAAGIRRVKGVCPF